MEGVKFADEEGVAVDDGLDDAGVMLLEAAEACGLLDAGSGVGADCGDEGMAEEDSLEDGLGCILLALDDELGVEVDDLSEVGLPEEEDSV